MEKRIVDRKRFGTIGIVRDVLFHQAVTCQSVTIFGPSADQDYDDSTLEDMLYRAHRAQVDHSVREDLSVSLSSSSMSDRTGQPVGDRPGQPGEHKNSEAQIRTLFDEQKQKVHTNFKQLKPKKSNDFFKDYFGSKSWNFVKPIKEVLLRWKNYGNFRSLPSIL